MDNDSANLNHSPVPGNGNHHLSSSDHTTDSSGNTFHDDRTGASGPSVVSSLADSSVNSQLDHQNALPQSTCSGVEAVAVDTHGNFQNELQNAPCASAGAVPDTSTCAVSSVSTPTAAVTSASCGQSQGTDVTASTEGNFLTCVAKDRSKEANGGAMGSVRTLKDIRERTKLRRQLVAKQLGVWCPDRLGEALGNTPTGGGSEDQMRGNRPRHRRHLAATKHTVALYTDSTTFLKGTQSANPHNDYCQHFVDTGHRPQNFIRDVGLADRFEEYPKLRELIKLKDDLIASTASPPSYLKADLHNFPLASLQCVFDVILVEPPLEEYQHTAPGHASALKGFWDWNQIRELDIAQVAAPRSFIFLWVGSSEGLDEGRRCLRSWGFRRCEDICWIRSNATCPGHAKNLDHKAVFQRTKEHCLMGIKGTVRRSTDGDFIHANVDIDLIITEESSSGTLDKPVEIFHIIEHFCLGKRRLHLFGRDPSIRPGWLTVGPDLSSSNFDRGIYSSFFNPETGGSLTTGCTDRIEALRPKSPPPKAGGKTRGGYSRGRARGR